MKTKKITILTFLALGGIKAFAQDASAEVMSKPLPISGEWILYLVGSVIALLLLLSLVLWKISGHLRKYYRGEFEKEEANEYKYSWERFLQFKPVSSDKDAMFHHDLDGIQELDNPPPPWFMFLFYGTILFAVIYFVRFTITGNGPTQQEEYVAELTAADEAHQAYLAKAANLIDETNVIAMTDAADLDAGKALFQEKCAVCHLADGGGQVGPNLTDEYWLHGGGVKEIFKTIKYGVTEKGMQSWQKDLNPKQMQQLASFILTLQGTKPATPKEPQGEKWVPEGAAPAPAAPADSTVKDVALAE